MTNFTISDVMITSSKIIFRKSSRVFSTIIEFEIKCSTIGLIFSWNNDANVDKLSYEENVFFSLFIEIKKFDLLISIDYIIVMHIQFDFQHYDVVVNNRDNIQDFYFFLKLWKNWFSRRRNKNIPSRAHFVSREAGYLIWLESIICMISIT